MMQLLWMHDSENVLGFIFCCTDRFKVNNIWFSQKGQGLVLLLWSTFKDMMQLLLMNVCTEKGFNTCYTLKQYFLFKNHSFWMNKTLLNLEKCNKLWVSIWHILFYIIWLPINKRNIGWLFFLQMSNL